jgi:hypothetical protein
LFDEASMLLGAFGRYSGGGALYERSIYLELANAGRAFKRDLKTERTRICTPRLNMSVLGHPFSFIEAFHAEKNNRDDGLTHRFFAACPPPTFYKSREINSTVDPSCNLLLVFYFIKVRYTTGKTFSLSDDAKNIFNEEYDNFRVLVEKTRGHSTYLAAMCGKGI